MTMIFHLPNIGIHVLFLIFIKQSENQVIGTQAYLEFSHVSTNSYIINQLHLITMRTICIRARTLNYKHTHNYKHKHNLKIHVGPALYLESD